MVCIQTSAKNFIIPHTNLFDINSFSPWISLEWTVQILIKNDPKWTLFLCLCSHFKVSQQHEQMLRSGKSQNNYNSFNFILFFKIHNSHQFRAKLLTIQDFCILYLLKKRWCPHIQLTSIESGTERPNSTRVVSTELRTDLPFPLEKSISSFLHTESPGKVVKLKWSEWTRVKFHPFSVSMHFHLIESFKFKSNPTKLE
jgi:hypothetical protein